MNKQGFTFLQDLFCLLVAVIATSLLLLNLATFYIAYQSDERQRELTDEARRICSSLLEYDKISHEGKSGLFESRKLQKLDVANLQIDLRIDKGFQLQIQEVHTQEGIEGSTWSWSSGTPQDDRGACVSSGAIWIVDGKVSPAKIVYWTWRI